MTSNKFYKISKIKNNILQKMERKNKNLMNQCFAKTKIRNYFNFAIFSKNQEKIHINYFNLAFFLIFF